MCQEREPARLILLSVTLTDCHRGAEETPGRRSREQENKSGRTAPVLGRAAKSSAWSGLVCVAKIFVHFHNQETTAEPVRVPSFTHPTSFSTQKVLDVITCQRSFLRQLFHISSNTQTWILFGEIPETSHKFASNWKYDECKNTSNTSLNDFNGAKKKKQRENSPHGSLERRGNSAGAVAAAWLHGSSTASR